MWNVSEKIEVNVLSKLCVFGELEYGKMSDICCYVGGK